MLVLPPGPDKTYREDRYAVQKAWAGCVAVLLVLGYIGWQVAQPPVVPPPNWGNPPLYPGAQAVAVETMEPGRSTNELHLGKILTCAPSKEITFYVNAPADTVLEWYLSYFTAEGWSYNVEPMDIGDFTPHYTTDFWHYGWYDKTARFAPVYFMNIYAGITPAPSTNVEILLGQLDQCWKPLPTPTTR